MKKDLHIYSHPSCLTLPYFLFWLAQAVSITDGSFLPCFFPYGLQSFTALYPKDNCIALKNIYAACFNKHTPKIPRYKLLFWHTFSCYGWLLSYETHKSSCLKICDLVWLLLDWLLYFHLWPCITVLWLCILNRWQEAHWRSSTLLM